MREKSRSGSPDIFFSCIHKPCLGGQVQVLVYGFLQNTRKVDRSFDPLSPFVEHDRLGHYGKRRKNPDGTGGLHVYENLLANRKSRRNRPGVFAEQHSLNIQGHAAADARENVRAGSGQDALLYLINPE